MMQLFIAECISIFPLSVRLKITNHKHAWKFPEYRNNFFNSAGTTMNVHNGMYECRASAFFVG
jgi:hypothetical protein